MPPFRKMASHIKHYREGYMLDLPLLGSTDANGLAACNKAFHLQSFSKNLSRDRR